MSPPFEAALAIEITPGTAGPAEDKALAQAVEDYIDRLYHDTAVCKPLAPILEGIIRDPAYRVRDEAAPRPRRGTNPLDPDGDREQVQRPALFGRSSQPAKPRPPTGEPIPPSQVALARAAPAGRRRRPATAAGGPVAAVPPVPPVAAVQPAVRRRWFKTLPPSAAYHSPGAASQETGNLRLGEAGHGIDHTTYFRNEFFASVVWTGTQLARGTRETTSVPIEVVIDGRVLGTRTFEVSYAPWREAGQRNITTFLHLGPISGELRATDYTDRVITIEQLSTGAYRLTIDTAETGPFVR